MNNKLSKSDCESWKGRVLTNIDVIERKNFFAKDFAKPLVYGVEKAPNEKTFFEKEKGAENTSVDTETVRCNLNNEKQIA